MSTSEGAPVPTMFERRCPRCGAPGAHARAEECVACGVRLESVSVQLTDGPPPPAVVYRPWVVWLLAALAIAFPFLPIPFLGGIAGFGIKLCVSVSIIKIIRDYRENMR